MVKSLQNLRKWERSSIVLRYHKDNVMMDIYDYDFEWKKFKLDSLRSKGIEK